QAGVERRRLGEGLHLDGVAHLLQLVLQQVGGGQAVGPGRQEAQGDLPGGPATGGGVLGLVRGGVVGLLGGGVVAAVAAGGQHEAGGGEAGDEPGGAGPAGGALQRGDPHDRIVPFGRGRADGTVRRVGQVPARTDAPV